MKVSTLKAGQTVGIRQINLLGKATFGHRGIVLEINPTLNTALVRYEVGGAQYWVNGIRLYVPEESAPCMKK